MCMCMYVCVCVYTHTYIHVCMPWIQTSDKTMVEYGICHKYKTIQSIHGIQNYNSEKYDKRLYTVLWVTFTHNKTNLQSKKCVFLSILLMLL